MLGPLFLLLYFLLNYIVLKFIWRGLFMEGPKSRLFNVDNLSAELRKRKEELENMLEAGLDKIDSKKGWTWVQKQKASGTLKQAYEDEWANQLAAAGIVVSPVFESVDDKDEAEKTLYEEFKTYETLWD
jgi:hypothetical protein